MSTACILLTASIDPKGSAFTKRSDPKVRERDYLEAVGFYSAKGRRPIVFCENSGYDLSAVRSALSRSAVLSEALQFDGQNVSAERRKGYGELLIIRHAVAHSKLIASNDYVAKITGRYKVENLDELTAPLRDRNDIFILSDYRPGDNSTYCAVFACKSAFITDYLAPLQEELDDLKGRTFEIILAKAIAAAAKDGKIVATFSVKPIVSGVSGTWDIKISRKDYKNLVFSWPRLKTFVRHTYGSIRRNLLKIFS